MAKLLPCQRLISSFLFLISHFLVPTFSSAHSSMLKCLSSSSEQSNTGVYHVRT